MDKYFRPVKVIEWLKVNQYNEATMKTYEFYKADSYDYKRNKEYLGYELSAFFNFLKNIEHYKKYVNSDYNPEIKIIRKNENSNEYVFNGITCKIKPEFINMFIYEKQSFKESIKDIKPELLTNTDSLTFAGEGTNLPADCKSKSITDMENFTVECNEKLGQLENSLKEQIKQKEEEFAIQISKMKLTMAESMKEAYTNMMKAKTNAANMESYFYRYLTYQGHTFEMKKLCSGESGTGSLVIWQKLRYLDEELPRLCTLDESYNHLDFESFKTFEEILSTNKYVRDFFLPSQKCVVAFQLSKSSTYHGGYFNTAVETTGSGRDTKIKAWLQYVENIYDLVNWNKLGLFLRNGDNVYVAWLDKEKINIIGDSLFVTNSSEDSEIKCDYKELRNVDDYVEKDKGWAALENLKAMNENNDKKISMYNKYMSRVYVVDVLQGILDNHKEILELPSGQSVLNALINKSYKDIIFNNADGYIENLKWKDFKDIYKEFSVKDEDIRCGNDIYVLVNDGGKDRGKVTSYKNITGSATLKRGLNKINHIDFEDIYVFYKDVNKSDFEKIANNYYILNGELKGYNACGHTFLKVVYKNDTENITYEKIYRFRDGTITKDYWERHKEPREEFNVYEIKNFDEVISMRFELHYAYISDVRRVEEPLVPRYKNVEEGWGSWKKTVTKQVNKIYDNLIDYYRTEIVRFKFAEDKSLRRRNYYFYVSCHKEWSSTNANILVETKEFISLKNITPEYLDYMISNKFVLPYFQSFSESLKAYLEIKEFIKSKESK